MPLQQIDLASDFFEPLILVIGDQHVILDVDLVKLYGGYNEGLHPSCQTQYQTVSQ